MQMNIPREISREFIEELLIPVIRNLLMLLRVML